MSLNKRVYAQYRDKQKAVAWYDIIPTIAAEIDQAAKDVTGSYDISTAGTEELDVIGRIVGVDRSFEAQFTGDQFLCGDVIAECGETDVECIPNLYTANQGLSNEIYRRVIRSKIYKNNCSATTDDIIAALEFIFDSSGKDIRVTDSEDMSFSVQFGFTLSEVDVLVLTKFDALPRPHGVKFSGYTELPSAPLCGEDFMVCGDPRAECGFIF